MFWIKCHCCIGSQRSSGVGVLIGVSKSDRWNEVFRSVVKQCAYKRLCCDAWTSKVECENSDIMSMGYFEMSVCCSNHWIWIWPGTRIVYDRSRLMQLRNSPLAKSPPPNMAKIPGITDFDAQGDAKSKSAPKGGAKDENTEGLPQFLLFCKWISLLIKNALEDLSFDENLHAAQCNNFYQFIAQAGQSSNLSFRLHLGHIKAILSNFKPQPFHMTLFLILSSYMYYFTIAVFVISKMRHLMVQSWKCLKKLSLALQ